MIIPPPHPAPFTNGIQHPDLWLWDSWVVRQDGGLHLYCLALSRVDESGAPIALPEFNDHRFHYRHFVSHDDGASWRDRGAVLSPGNIEDRSDARNVWSGGVHALPSGRILFGYTGIAKAAPDHPYLQTITFAKGGLDGPDTFPSAAHSHPMRDREAIIAAGYYLPNRGIGHRDGEDGGPILAWRDPFMFESAGTLHAVWSAKVAASIPAVAHATLKQTGTGLSLDLLPPIRLPDDAEYTQAEVPKICRDADTGDWLMMVSACNRVHESQPDSDVWKELRLYRSAHINGPWQAAFPSGATIPGTDTLFGASFLDRETQGSIVRLISPYWAAGGERAMSFAPVMEVRLA